MERVYKRNEECCGCTACENICPVNAICMITDEKGFKYPKINQDKCIDCNMCRKICPMLNDVKEKEQLKIYASKSKDEDLRSTSSSGGVFGTMAQYMFEHNGVVFGAVFDDEFKVVHSKATNLNDLERIKKSKYVQSDLKETFNEVKEELKNGKRVLFSGTPCQVFGLKNYIGKNNLENLILVDFVCYGVPSPVIFEDYKKYLEEKYNSKIININFRYKTEGQVQKIKVEFKNGKEYISSVKDEPKDYMYALFFKDIMLRDSCCKCKFKNINRISDVTLADFWGIEKTDKKDFDDKKGVSLVLVNTEKGYRLMENIKNNLYIKEATREECMKYNSLSYKEIETDKDIFWKEYFEHGFEYIAEKYSK